MKANPIDWLLEDDPDNPGIRYLTLRRLLDRPEDSPEVRSALDAVMHTGPVPKILAVQQPDGSWTAQEHKYQSTYWQIIFLAELGADARNDRIHLGCRYLLEHLIAANHAFSYIQPPIPSQALYCMNGMLAGAFLTLGWLGDKRLEAVYEWLARAITGDLPSNQYYKSTTAGPIFACGVNLGQPCGWGATKAMRALASLPEQARTAPIRKALQVGVDFLLSYDLARANFPYTERISSTWFKFGFPPGYWSDVLETAGVLVDLGYQDDPRLAGVLQLILNKQDEQGRWKMENSLNGKTWANIEGKGQPSKWITLRALKVLKHAVLNFSDIV